MVAFLFFLLQVMFSSVLHKRLPAEAGISVLCVSPGIVQTNVVSLL
jgi:short-subunit dehydrogenase